MTTTAQPRAREEHTLAESVDFESFQRAASTAFVGLHAEAISSTPFAGRILAHRYDDVSLSRVDARAHRVVRTDDLIAAGGGGQFKFTLQLSGHGLLIQDGRETLLRPGDLAVYDTSRPYSLTFEEECGIFVAMVPRERLGATADDVAELTALRLGGDGGLLDMVAPTMGGLARRMAQMPGNGRRLVGNTVELIVTLCDDEAQRRLGDTESGRRGTLRRVHRFIEDHLADPRLSPQLVADAHYMSVRALYKLFDDTGSTVAAWIRRRRLERARADLQDPAQRTIPVGVVAARWGLPDPAHFSRLYRAAYGCSPSEERRAEAA